MPTIEVPGDPHDEPQGLVVRGHFGDILFTPVAPPEPEEDMTEEEWQHLHFTSDVQTEAPVMDHRYDEPAISRAEVCVLGGWPRRHVSVGAHCPHGMLETMEMDDD
jgi:hypothetical protein